MELKKHTEEAAIKVAIVLQMMESLRTYVSIYSFSFIF